MKKFLTQVAEYIQDSNPKGLGEVLVIFPNNRAGYFYKQEAQRLAGEGATLPQVTTIQQFVYSLSESKVAPNVELINKLYRVYTGAGGTDSYESFIGTAQTMLADFEEIDRQLVNPRIFFNDLNNLKSLTTFLDDEETLTEYAKSYRQFWTLFRDCYFGLTAELREQKKAYSAMLYREVAENIANLKKEGVSRIYFVGFSGLSKSEEKIVTQLLDRDAEFLIDADTYYLHDINQEAGYFFRAYKKAWKIKSFKWIQDCIQQDKKNIEVIGVARNIGQAKLAADLLQNHIKLSTTNMSDTVVVLLDEKMLQPLLAALPDAVDKVNITMGLPLSDRQAADFIRHISDLQNNAAVSERSGSLRFYHRDVIALLQHSYYRLLSQHVAELPQCIRDIKRNNKISIRKKELDAWFPNDKTLIDTIFKKAETAAEYLQKTAGIIDLLQEKMQALITSGNMSYQQDAEILRWLREIISNLQEQIMDFELVWDIKAIQKLIDNEIRSVRLPFDSDRADGLQIMGILETRCLDYKNVILLSMNEGIFPSGKSINTYIPHEMRWGSQMTTHRERDSIAAYLFYRLLQRAENIYIAYNTESDLLGGGEKSRFILQIQHELANHVNITMRERNFVLSADIKQEDRPIVVHKDDAVQKLLKTYLAEKGLSPTALNTYINCSLQFYFKHILSLREEEDIEEELESSTIGTAVHYALEEIYKPVLNTPLSPAYLKAAIADKEKIDTLIRSNLEKRFEAQSLKQGKNYLLYHVCKSLVLNFLKNEVKRLETLAGENKNLIITMLEHEMKKNLTVNDYEVYIHGFTDRVDIVEGVINITDYKTGDSKHSKLKVEELAQLKTDTEYSKAFQLLMYAWLYKSNYGPLTSAIRSGIYWLRHADGKYEAFQSGKSDLIDATTIQAFEQILLEILQSITDNDTPFSKAEDTKRCAYCDFKRICGRD